MGALPRRSLHGQRLRVPGLQGGRQRVRRPPRAPGRADSPAHRATTSSSRAAGAPAKRKDVRAEWIPPDLDCGQPCVEKHHHLQESSPGTPKHALALSDLILTVVSARPRHRRRSSKHQAPKPTRSPWPTDCQGYRRCLRANRLFRHRPRSFLARRTRRRRRRRCYR